ncbi:urease accessory protein UreE [Thiolapillus sp.]
MLEFEEKTQPGGQVHTTLTLALEQRIKSRMKVTLDDGRKAGLFFEKGVSFQDGDLIISTDGKVLVEIKAACEPLSVVYCDTPLLLARASYHLGNRHVPLQIGEGVLYYQQDHVLDEMLKCLGLEVQTELAPFQPEAGAYNGAGHMHHHG